MSVQEYEELTPYAGDLVENWGKAPGHLNTDGQNLLVFGCKFGNIFIGVQPSFGYEVGACPEPCSHAVSWLAGWLARSVFLFLFRLLRLFVLALMVNNTPPMIAKTITQNIHAT